MHAHPGNQKLRAIVQSEVEAYSNAKNRADKTIIIARVFETIRAASSVGFVKRDPSTKVFITVEDTAAKMTIAQYFRDALADQRRYKSSKKYKQELRDAVRRSVSVGDEHDESIVTSCSRTNLLRQTSAPEPTCVHFNKFPPKTLLANSCFQNATDKFAVVGASTIATTENPRHHDIHNIRNLLQTVADLLEDDDCGFLNDEAPIPIQVESSTKDVFSSLYNAFGSDAVVTPNPYEPTPIDEF